MRNLTLEFIIFLFICFLFNPLAFGQDSTEVLILSYNQLTLSPPGSLTEPSFRIRQNRSDQFTSSEADCEEGLKYSFSINCYKDLSDTYDGGDLFSGEFLLAGSCFGLMASIGYFQSHSIFTYNVIIEEINRSLSIQFDELAIMKTGSLSLVLIPVKAGRFSVEALGGLVLAGSKSLRFFDLDYSYSFVENRFNYLYRNYMYSREIHFGYQAGMNAKIEIFPEFGIQLNMRMQDLSGGGTFFFSGAGLWFKLN